MTFMPRDFGDPSDNPERFRAISDRVRDSALAIVRSEAGIAGADQAVTISAVDGLFEALLQAFRTGVPPELKPVLAAFIAQSFAASGDPADDAAA